MLLLKLQKHRVTATIAAIDSAKSGIIQSKTKVDAATATERRIMAELDDSILKLLVMAVYNIVLRNPVKC